MIRNKVRCWYSLSCENAEESVKSPIKTKKLKIVVRREMGMTGGAVETSRSLLLRTLTRIAQT